MSLLVRSLLALTALLAAADAIMPNPCTIKKYEHPGFLTAKSRQIRFPPGGGQVRSTENACKKKYGSRFSHTLQQVEACSYSEFAPSITKLGDWTFNIECPEDENCPEGGFVYIMENCGPYYGK